MTAWADNPQAAQIDALIVRAGRLTSVECDRLATATVRFEVRVAVRVAVRGAADAARGAARFADWDAAWVAVRGAARDAARDTDWDAAWFAADVAVALVVRDLIDEGTRWDRAAYDLLTGPWRRIIGPIHPDDEVI